MIEIASGRGQHAAHFAAGLPGWDWQPTDAEPGALASIAGQRRLRRRPARAQPAWGLRRLSDVMRQAEAARLGLRERVAMPANTLLLVLARSA